jgi:Trypsin-like peptidase domain
MIKTGDADKAAENLRFLADAGLVADPNRLAAIRRFLANRSPGQGPSLPPPSGTSGLQPTRTLPQSDPLRASTSAVSQLLIKNGDDSLKNSCTAFRVADSLVLTASYCLGVDGDPATVSKAFFAPISADGTARASFEVALPPKEVITLKLSSGNNSLHLDAILLELKTPHTISGGWLTLSSAPPSPGQLLGAVAFLASPEQMIARDPGCQVIEVKDFEFSHHCSLGPGSGGAPILTADGRIVVGVEMWGQRNRVGRSS